MDETSSVQQHRTFIDLAGDGILFVTEHKDGNLEGYVFSIIDREGRKSVSIVVAKQDFLDFVWNLDVPFRAN